VLQPTSRWPTTLPEETIQSVLAADPDPTSVAAPLAANSCTPRASIVVVTLNNLVYNKLCLRSILANTDHPSYEVIAVDNGSSDGTRDCLADLVGRHQHVRLLANPSNRGFAAATNQGLASARGNILVLLNNDTLVPRGWLTGLARHLEDPGVGLVGPVTNRSGNEAQIEAPYETYGEFEKFAHDHARQHEGQGFEIRTATMFCTALRRDVYERVGPLDERFEIGLFEDEDYSIRVRAAGYRVICAEDVFLHHFGQASIGKLAATGEYGELFHRNRRRWEEKWRACWTPHQHRRTTTYRQNTEQIRALVQAALPPGATVIVISRGDEELLDLGGRKAWHFPQNEGGYAGHYPADSAAAIDHLELLRARGGEFLLLPATARWWLDHYAGFREHLERRYSLIRDEDSCVIFHLRQSARAGMVGEKV
jgi:GT2 family glycosyltransferase